jgi:hypothetical protein
MKPRKSSGRPAPLSAERLTLSEIQTIAQMAAHLAAARDERDEQDYHQRLQDSADDAHYLFGCVVTLVNPNPVGTLKKSTRPASYQDRELYSDKGLHPSGRRMYHEGQRRFPDTLRTPAAGKAKQGKKKEG